MPIFKLPVDTDGIPQTGERFHVGQRGEIEFEHYHRYLFATQFCNDRDVLDVACGEGYGGVLLSQVARTVVGVDIDATVIEYAEKTYTSDRLHFLHGSCLKLPASDGSFDVVVSFETIEHIREHDEFLAEVRRVLRPNGLLIISTPDRDVYADPDKPNPFHVLELTKLEFQKALSQHFAFIEVGLQKAIAGSAVMPDQGEEVAIQIFYNADDRTFEPGHRLKSAPFVLAIASNVKMPVVRWGILDCSTFFGDQRGEIEHRDLEVERLLRDLRDRDKRLVAADGDLRRVVSEVAQRDRQLGAADRDLRRLTSEVEDRDRRLVVADSDLRRLLGEVEPRERRLAMADADLRRLMGEIEDRERRLEAADGNLRRLMSEVEDRERRLEAVDSDLRRLMGEVEDRERRLRAADGDLRRLMGEVEEREARLRTADGDLRRLMGEVEEREGRLRAADGDLRRLMGEVEERERRLGVADGDLRRLMGEVEDRKERLEAALDELHRLVGELEDRELRLRAAEGDLRRLTSEVEDRNQQCCRLISQIEDRDQRLADANDELRRILEQGDLDLRQANCIVADREREVVLAGQALDGLTKDVWERDQRLAALGQRLQEIETSTTWRVTAPIRKLFSGWRRALPTRRRKLHDSNRS